MRFELDGRQQSMPSLTENTNQLTKTEAGGIKEVDEELQLTHHNTVAPNSIDMSNKLFLKENDRCW